MNLRVTRSLVLAFAVVGIASAARAQIDKPEIFNIKDYGAI